MNNYNKIMELADQCDKLLKEVDGEFIKLSRGGFINTTVGTTKIIKNLKKANSLFKKLDDLTSIRCLNCGKKVGMMPDGSWQHRVPPYHGKTDEDFAAYQMLINSTDWRYCDNPPVPGRIAIPKIVPETDFTEEEKAEIEAKAKELTEKYDRYLKLIQQANEIAKDFLKSTVKAPVDAVKNVINKVKGDKEDMGDKNEEGD